MAGLWSAITVVEESVPDLDQALCMLDPTVSGIMLAEIEEPTITPEDTLREAAIRDARQAAYQRKMSARLGKRPNGAA